MPATLHTGPLRAFRVQPVAQVMGGIVVLPGLGGIDDVIRDFARRLAVEGYLVYVPDLLAGLNVDRDVGERAEQILHLDGDSDADPEVGLLLEVLESPGYQRWVVRAMRALIDTVVESTGVDGRVAVLGSGFGGGQALAAAAADSRVRLALAYDLSAPDIDLVENIKGVAVTFYAENDSSATDVMPELRAAMRRAGVPFATKSYPGRRTALRELGRGRMSAAANDLWQRSLAMLGLHLA